MEFTYRPLLVWRHTETPEAARRWSPFKAGWQNTMDLLDREIRMLAGTNCIIGAFFRPSDLRQDGLPRADAREPSHPGIELSFDSTHGRLVYATDVCRKWQDNVRSIALGLESLRAVDRFGISQRGEQYAGWLQLETRQASPERGAELVKQHGGLRKALMRTHPDRGGDIRDWHDVQAYREATGATM